MFRICRNGRGNRTFVGFHGQRAGLELHGVNLPWRVCPVERAHVHDERLDALRCFMPFMGEARGNSNMKFISAA